MTMLPAQVDDTAARVLQQQIDDKRFALEIRRGLITIARALAARYNCKWLLIVLGVEN